MKIENLSDLEFLDEGFGYKGKSYSYDDIDAISFEATHIRHTVNSVPAGNSYTSRLDLHLTNGRKLRIEQEWAILGKRQKARMEAVWRAKELFSELTFDSRVKKYEKQLTMGGLFLYASYQFYKDGSVFRNGKFLFNFADKDNRCLTWAIPDLFHTPKVHTSKTRCYVREFG